MRVGVVGVFVVGLVALGIAAASSTPANAQRSDDQEVMGPGLYIYQTRITGASCEDATRTGYVDSFVAAINGVPGSRTMDMMLTNSDHWKEWDLTVQANGTIVGVARVRNRSARFEVRRNGSRFTGTGNRQYNSNGQRCRIDFDALLRRIDV